MNNKIRTSKEELTLEEIWEEWREFWLKKIEEVEQKRGIQIGFEEENR